MSVTTPTINNEARDVVTHLQASLEYIKLFANVIEEADEKVRKYLRGGTYVCMYVLRFANDEFLDSEDGYIFNNVSCRQLLLKFYEGSIGKKHREENGEMDYAFFLGKLPLDEVLVKITKGPYEGYWLEWTQNKRCSYLSVCTPPEKQVAARIGGSSLFSRILH
jgi:hypothetical protein